MVIFLRVSRKKFSRSPTICFLVQFKYLSLCLKEGTKCWWASRFCAYIACSAYSIIIGHCFYIRSSYNRVSFKNSFLRSQRKECNIMRAYCSKSVMNHMSWWNFLLLKRKKICQLTMRPFWLLKIKESKMDVHIQFTITGGSIFRFSNIRFRFDTRFKF